MNNNISTFRKKEGMTQVELANKLGIQRTYLSEIETGKATPSMKLSMRISLLLRQPMDKIFYPQV